VLYDTKAEAEARNLSATLCNLLEHPTPEVQQAINTLGVMECLAMLAGCPSKRSQCFGLAIDAFVLGCHVAGEQVRLNNLFDKQLVKTSNSPEICKEKKV
jgi:hypothetical protein